MEYKGVQDEFGVGEKKAERVGGIKTMNYDEAIAQLKWYLELHFHVGVDDVEITESRGYWRFKKPCDDSCHAPIHGCIGNGNRMKHTIYFTTNSREKGKFVSPYEVWETIRAHKGGEEHVAVHL
jgi:hypothetical protein